MASSKMSYTRSISSVVILGRKCCEAQLRFYVTIRFLRYRVRSVFKTSLSRFSLLLIKLKFSVNQHVFEMRVDTNFCLCGGQQASECVFFYFSLPQSQRFRLLLDFQSHYLHFLDSSRSVLGLLLSVCLFCTPSYKV